MSKSLAAAEKAAIEGTRTEEWDTQMCRELQEEFLSSSPAPTAAIASSKLPLPRTIPPLDQEPELVQIDDNYDDHWESQSLEDELKDNEELITTTEPITSAPLPKDDGAITYKKNKAGKLRPYNHLGEEVLPTTFQADYRRLHPKVMDDHLNSSQKSSVSLTQANSASVYERFNHGDYLSTALPDDQPQNADSLHSRYASARTESTAVTYEEGDARHIRIDYQVEGSQESEHIEEDLEESQDTYIAPQAEMTSHHDPQTPAAPVNPFTLQGSVMKGAELFSATQPSSMGRYLETPASARPSSPNMYNSESPLKRRRDLSMSSPSGGAFVDAEAETSPIKSSRQAITHSVSMDSPFNAGIRTTSMDRVHEPRPYRSMAASQERRILQDTTPESSDDDGFDDDIPAGPRRKNTAIDKELASIGLSKKPMQASSTPAAVEVPSTRRRSVEEEYIAQCVGHDARDTQQHDSQQRDSQQTEETQSQNDVTDEIIADSQALPVSPEVSSIPIIHSSESLPPVHSQQDDVDTRGATPPSAIINPEVSEVSSPPHQGDSSNTQEIGTPTRKPNHIFTVPETSPSNEPTTPAEDFLHPMGDIAEFSQSVDNDLMIDYDDIHGLTQDTEFERVRQIRDSSPTISKATQRNLPEPLVGPLVAFKSTNFGQDDEGTAASLVVDHVAVPVFVVPALPVTTDEAPNKPDSSNRSSIGTAVSSSLSEMDTPLRPINFLDSNHSSEATPFPVTESIASDHAKASTEAVGKQQEIQLPQSSNDEPQLSLLQEDSIQMDAFAGNEQSPLPKNSEDKLPRRDIFTKDTARDNTTDETIVNVSDDLANDDASDSDLEVELPKHKVNAQPLPAKTPGSKKKTAKSKAPATRSGKKSNTTSLRRIATIGAHTTPASSPRNMTTPVSNSAASKRTSKRTSGATPVPTRHSKRQSTMRESSEDPLALGVSATSFMPGLLFTKMAFAISYVNPDKDRDVIVKLITDNGGTILQEGFDVLFETSKGDTTDLRLSKISRDLGFTALIADEHSRKVKFIQALALGLPCISGYWVSACVTKGQIVDWAPYLLCAGMSSVLNATKSRMLSPYSAATARLADVITSRHQLLEGKSVLFVAGKTKAELETRQAYTFLTRVLGPSRITRVGDLSEARKKLVEGVEEWDMLYVDVNKARADKAVFGATVMSVAKSKGKKRKRAKEDSDDEVDLPPKKRIPIIVDETMVQSLIMGQFLDEK